jgi:hypothetical protein
VAHLREQTFPRLAGVTGHAGSCILRRAGPDQVEFTVITFWESLEDIGRFAGDDVERAVVPPEAQALLESYDARATHWEVARWDAALDKFAELGAK